MKYFSTKTYGHERGLSCCFRQWRASSHCRLVHGYALSVKLVFMADTLDDRGWVMDFGALDSVERWLKDQFDHTLAVAEDDPMLGHFQQLEAHGLADLRIVPATGCEAFSRQVHAYMEDWLVAHNYSPRVRLHGAEVREHGANSAGTIGG